MRGITFFFVSGLIVALMLHSLSHPAEAVDVKVKGRFVCLPPGVDPGSLVSEPDEAPRWCRICFSIFDTSELELELASGPIGTSLEREAFHWPCRMGGAPLEAFKEFYLPAQQPQ